MPEADDGNSFEELVALAGISPSGPHQLTESTGHIRFGIYLFSFDAIYTCYL